MTHPSIVGCFLHPITKYGYPPSPAKTTDILAEMKGLGFQSIELEGIHEGHLSAIHEIRKTIAHEARKLELAIPYFCVVLPGLSSADPDEREQNLKLFEMGCEVASELGSLGVLDNAPIPPYRFPDGIPVTRHYEEDVLRNAALPDGLEWARYWDCLAATFTRVCDIAARYDLTYQVHPCLGALASTTDAFIVFRDAVDRANLRFNLDTANLFAVKDNLVLSLHRLASAIDYIHLSDNRGNQVEHLIPGDGAIDFDTFFDHLSRTGFDGRIGIDVGGAESEIGDVDAAYRRSAEWLAARWPKTE